MGTAISIHIVTVILPFRPFEISNPTKALVADSHLLVFDRHL